MRTIITVMSFVFPVFLRIRLLNILGHQISRKAIIKPFSIISARKLELDNYARIESFAVILGLDTLKMGKRSTISRLAYISGSKELTLRDRAFVGSRCIINTSCGDINIGEYCAISPRSTILTHGTFLPVTHGYSFKNKGVTIGHYTWIMQSASIGPGVNIGSNVIVLPGSVIVKAIPDNIVVYDTPVERKTFPINLFKKELTNPELEKLIKDITIHYLNTLKGRNTIIDYSNHDYYIEVKTKTKSILIHFCMPKKTDFGENRKISIDCYFWYDIEKEIMSSRTAFVLDFRKIVHSLGNPPKELRDYNAFTFYEYGLKFINY